MAAIEKRGENSYRLTVSCGYNLQGKKIVKRKTIDLSHISPKKQADEAHKQWILFKQEVEKGTYLDASKITFEEFAQKWLADYAEKDLEPKTLYRYKEMLSTRIIPALGHIKLEKLQPPHLIDFYNNLRDKGIRLDYKYIINSEMASALNDAEQISAASGVSTRTIAQIVSGKTTNAKTARKLSDSVKIKIDKLFIPINKEEGLSGRTISHHHRLISSILTSAVQWQLILSNPCERVKPPKVEKQEAKHYDEEQTERMLKLLEQEPLKYRMMINLVIFSGMRLGELSGLTWENIDFKNNLISINQAEQYLPGAGSFNKSPKNETSKRTISMPVSVMELLQTYKAWQNEKRLKLGDLWQDNNRIFTQWNGKPLFYDTPSKWFSKFIAKHNLPKLTFHQLRHTNATLLIGEGVDIKTVSSRLGHARTSTTSDIYTHSLKRPDKMAADKLENLFKKNISETQKQG